MAQAAAKNHCQLHLFRRTAGVVTDVEWSSIHCRAGDSRSTADCISTTQADDRPACHVSLVPVPTGLYLRTGNVHPAAYSLFHWGYTIDNPTILNVLRYLGFTFGFKWLFIGLAVVWMSWFQRRWILAVSGLITVAFLFQFS